METRVAACSFFLGGFVLILVCLLFGGFFFSFGLFWFLFGLVFFNCWLKGALMTACSFPLVVFTLEIAEFKAPNWTSC